MNKEAQASLLVACTGLALLFWRPEPGLALLGLAAGLTLRGWMERRFWKTPIAPAPPPMAVEQQALAAPNSSGGTPTATAYNPLPYLEALLEATETLGQTLMPRAILEAACASAPAVAGAQAAAIFTPGPEETWTAFALHPAQMLEVEAPLKPLSTRQAAPEPGLLVVTDAQTDLRALPVRPALAERNLQALVEVPLVASDRQTVLAVLVVYFSHSMPWPAPHLQLIQRFAQQVCRAYQNAELVINMEYALNQRVIQLSLLAETGREMTSIQDLRVLCDLVLDRAIQGTSTQAGLLFLARSLEQLGCPSLVAVQGYQASTPISPSDPDELPALFGDLCRELYGFGKPIVINASRFAQHEAFPRLREKAQAQLAVPMFYNNQVVGALLLEHDATAEFSQKDIVFVTQLLVQASIAMNNIDLVSNLADQRDRLQVILDTLNEGIILLHGATQRIILANPRLNHLLDLHLAQIIGPALEELLEHPQLQFAARLGFSTEAFRAFAQHLQQGEWAALPQRHEYHLDQPTRRFLQRRAAPVHDHQQRIVGALLVFSDVTEEQELKRTQEELTSMIVHDLRSPLTAVTASLRFLQDIADPTDSFGKTVIQAAEVSGRAARKLLNLVSSLLDIYKLEAGIISLESEPTALHALVEATCAELAPLATEMDVTLQNEVTVSLPLLEIDADKIERVLYNLIDNAVKFTPAEERIRITATPMPNNLVQVGIIDQGPGIPNSYKEVLFDRFVQVGKQQARRRGTGLGLTFCKLAVEAHGGHIWIEDNPAGGSVFYFTLPIANLPPAAAAPG
ncbi:MAG: GAF domain-containing protein [Anaerolineae bacterium]|nr:GAF domain-containing protein [Anaerolineae bacterium]